MRKPLPRRWLPCPKTAVMGSQPGVSGPLSVHSVCALSVHSVLFAVSTQCVVRCQYTVCGPLSVHSVCVLSVHSVWSADSTQFVVRCQYTVCGPLSVHSVWFAVSTQCVVRCQYTVCGPLSVHSVWSTVSTQCLVRCQYTVSDLQLLDRLVGLVVKTSASRAEDSGFESRLRLDFSGSNHYSDSKIGTPVATLPGAWRYRVSAGTGCPGV